MTPNRPDFTILAFAVALGLILLALGQLAGCTGSEPFGPALAKWAAS